MLDELEEEIIAIEALDFIKIAADWTETVPLLEANIDALFSRLNNLS